MTVPLRDYTVKLADGDDAPRLHFKLVEADIEKDNRKAADDKKRVFIFNPEKTEVLANEIVLGFEYRADPDASKQETAIADCVDYVKAHTADFGPLAPRILALRPTDKNKDRTLLEKHLSDYTSKNSMDYFIHKDLGGFLRRELDFYIKNEVMHLDDIENETAPRVEQYLAQVRVIRGIAHKLIDFLAQLEDFQKKLWLKKKFVVESNYCVTLDRVPEELYPQIAQNEAQIQEWVKLGFLEKSDPQITQKDADLFGDDLRKSASSADNISVEMLKANPYLVLDTAFFNSPFKQKLLASIENIDEQCDGLLIHSENFQALHLLQERYKAGVGCAYIDPPYNTGGDGFFYKDAYRHSSWLSMITDRLTAVHGLFDTKGVIFSSIDANERSHLEKLLNETFGTDNRVEEIIWVQNTTKNQSPTYSTNHEYVEVYAKDIEAAKKDFGMFREAKPGCAEIMELMQSINPQYPPVKEIESTLRALFKQHRKSLETEGEDDLDEWKGIYNYNRAEYRDQFGNYVQEVDAAKKNAKIWVWREDNPSMPQVKEDSQKPEFRDPNDPTFRFYQPMHPVTGKPCPYPKRGWSWPYHPYGKQKNCFASLASDNRIAWGDDENKIPQTKRFLHEVETNVAKSVVNDYTDGEKELTVLFGKTRSFSGPKPTTLIARFCQQATSVKDVVMDFFSGSGTTGHAVINLNREDGGKRKYILVEMGEHFDTVLKPRIQKVVYSKDWKDGKPVPSQDNLRSSAQSADKYSGISHCFKYIRLESYEDCLNNLELKRTVGQDDLLNRNQKLKEDYTLRYMLDVESRDSLLNPAAFADPFACTLKIAAGSVGESKPVTVDLVETFNYLIGLKVKTMDTIRGVQVITGENLAGEKILVLWRKVAETDSEALNQWFVKQGYNTQDMEFDIIFVNGDNFLENLRKDEQTWKVRLTEEEFLRRMFNEEGGV